MSAIRRVVLVGFMGAGKTQVGRRVANELGWAHVDLDEEIVREAGRSIEEIFRDSGEEAFRVLEERVGGRCIGRDRIVLSTGGGWAVEPGRMETLDSDTLSVWLDVGAETAVRRAGHDRPLLAVTDPVARARELLQARVPYYRKARLVLDSDRSTPFALAQRIVEVVRGEPEVDGS